MTDTVTKNAEEISLSKSFLLLRLSQRRGLHHLPTRLPVRRRVVPVSPFHLKRCSSYMHLPHYLRWNGKIRIRS